MRISEKIYNQLPLEYKKHFTKLFNESKEEVLQNFPYSKSSGDRKGEIINSSARSWKNSSVEGISRIDYTDEGSASRFFYCAKPWYAVPGTRRTQWE